jgi:hypothetical protein
VLVERDQVGAAPLAARLIGLREVVSSPTLALYAVPTPLPTTHATAPLRLTLAADSLVGLAVLMVSVSLAEIRTRTHRTV